MRAIILAAGYGNRMRPLTNTSHKTLLKIGDKTVIEKIINSLTDNGIKDIIIATGYRHEDLKEFLKDTYPKLNIRYVHNPRFAETNNIYSLSLTLEAIPLDNDIILIESDLIYESAVIKRILDSNHENIAVVDKYQSGMDGTVVAVSDDIITNIIPPHLQTTNFDFSDKYKTLNIYKFSKEFLNANFKKLITYYSKVFDDNCYYELILGMLIYVQRETIHALILNGERWAEIDDPNDLSLAQFVFDEKNRLPLLEKSFGGLWNHNVVDFCYIRNMYFPNNAIFAEMRNNLHKLIQNYGTTQETLNQKLAYFLLCKKDNLNVINGASQAYPILQSYLKGKRVLIPFPTFGEYSRVLGHPETYADKGGFNTTELENKSQKCDVIIFVNPNNPTGSVIQTEKIYAFAKSNSEKTIIVDESFIEFSGQKSIIELLEAKPLSNVIVLKSLSKSCGVPGIRLGFLYACDPEFNTYVREQLPIWNMNSLAEFFLEIVLKHRPSLQQSFERTIEDRDNFVKALKKLSFLDTVFPSAANFILIALKKTPKSSKIAETLLSKHNLYVKDISTKFSKENRTYLRIAVRLPEENDHLIECLKKCAI